VRRDGEALRSFRAASVFLQSPALFGHLVGHELDVIAAGVAGK
jgi:hypothetical protein